MHLETWRDTEPLARDSSRLLIFVFPRVILPPPSRMLDHIFLIRSARFGTAKTAKRLACRGREHGRSSPISYEALTELASKGSLLLSSCQSAGCRALT
jgi:hypothetical protein